MRKLPIYKLTINEEENKSGVSVISLVEEPAIQVDWFAFDTNQPKEFKFTEVSKDKQLLAAPFMIPNQLIYRRDGVNEYFVVFDVETIDKIAEKFNKNLLADQFNKDHSAKNKLEGVFVKSNWIIEDKEYDMSKKYGFDLPIGTWFGVVKVDDKKVWDEYVKTGKVKGFSVEGNFDPVYEGLSELFGKQETELNINDLSVIEFIENLEINLSKIGFDFDETLSTSRGKDLAKEYLSKNDELFIVTARQSDNSESVYKVADELGISHDKIFFTNGKDKYEKVAELGLDKFYDNNTEQIKKINENTKTEGIKFHSNYELYIINFYKNK